MDITGKWKGFYEYGEGYNLPYFGQRVTIYVTIQGHNDKFYGTVEEEPSNFSVPLKATIEGFTEDDLVSFVKRYPKRPIITEEGKIDVEIEEGITEIEHVGIVDVKHKVLYGSCTIYDVVEDEFGTFEYTSHGIWLLKPL